MCPSRRYLLDLNKTYNYVNHLKIAMWPSFPSELLEAIILEYHKAVLKQDIAINS